MQFKVKAGRHWAICFHEKNENHKCFVIIICFYRIYYDLISFGDRFTKQEATEALEEAPMIKPKTLGEPVMIDYQAFCRTLCGLRKRRKWKREFLLVLKMKLTTIIKE